MTEILESIEVEQTEAEPIDLQQTNGQIPTKAFHFKVTHHNQPPITVTVLAPSSTSAREGLKQQFPNALAQQVGVSEHIIQVNDQTIVDV